MLKKIFLTVASIKNLNVFILDYLGLIKKKEVIYKTRNDLKFFARTKTCDKSEIVIVCSGSEYPKKYFPKGDNLTVLDIGAHIGTFSAYFYRSLYSSKPLIYAIEPALSNFKNLARNIELNSFNSIKCFNVAIGDKNGFGYIDTAKSSDGFSVSDNKPEGSFEKCEVSTIEDFCIKQGISNIDLLKIDCEGGEYKIFNKSIEYIKKNVRFIFAEVHNLGENKNMREFKKILVKNNLKVEAEILNRTLFIRNLNL